MWINDITLGDFGCFDHEQVTDLQEGVNVIVGPQRAGKTTFMQALRHLGYGIPRDGSVPPATNTYSLGATVTIPEGEYRIDIDGHGTPTVSPVYGPEQSVEDLYANLQTTQYHQLYTISLDELRRTPRSLDDDHSLAEVLLGGAFGDVVKLPQYRDEFSSDAKSIGGKHGRGVYQLKDPIETINDGVHERKEATAQVDEYEAIETKVEAKTQRLEEIQSHTNELDTEQVLLEAISSNYEEIQRLKQLNEELEHVDESKLDAFPLDRQDAVTQQYEAYKEARANVAERRRVFSQETSHDATDAYLESLQAHEDRIRQHLADLSGLRERHNQLVERQDSLQREWGGLSRQAAALNEEWDGDLDAVQEIEADTIARDRVRQITSDYADAIEQRESAREELKEALNRKYALEEQLEDAKAEQTENESPSYIAVAGGAVIALLLGTGVATIVNPVAGVFVTFLILAVTGAMAYRQFDPSSGTETAVQNLDSDLRQANANVDQKEAAVEAAEESVETSEGEFIELCQSLGLPTTVEPEAVAAFHDDVQNLKTNIRRVESEKGNCEQKIAELREDLKPLGQTLVNVGALETIPDDPFEDVNRLFETIARVGEHTQTARKVQRAETEVTAARQKLIGELETWDEIENLEGATFDELAALVEEFLQRAATVDKNRRKRDDRDQCQSNLQAVFRQESVAVALSDSSTLDTAAEGGISYQSDTDEILGRVIDVVERYGEKTQITDRLEQVQIESQELEKEAEQLRDTRAELLTQLDDLRSADDVNEAYTTIQEGKKRLEPLAEEYATNRIAEYFLDELYDRFIDRTTGPLLDDASSIFERITNGTYERVETHDELEELNFAALLAEGGRHSPNELSRATVEQLFLAIRVARIKRESQPLPVILDDSFTNFDPSHRERTMQVIKELASTNQVFILTCHPEIVEAISGLDVGASYWKLDSGRFDGPTTDVEAEQILRIN
ncbi:AAA family ATPase [Halorubrum vacuolatum]|uniref:Uncharacterized protein YhaN n=1 Tax=Halorubrum vacuolatum TaxID=63740 RepID=A0A238YG91_HALVU|nr:AAA family ATPase [Halorubrum vacuolatum]SNR70266.1 Uncharacterized protein YhaN [Halorubrum vacuolatum]